MQITKVMYTETGHRLTNYVGRCAHFHGHSYRWEITVSGDNLDNGMVMDFKKLKGILNNTIDTLDHALILHGLDPFLEGKTYNAIIEMFKATDGTRPRLFIVDFNPTVENLTKWQMEEISFLLPKGILLSSITCWETANSSCTLTSQDLK